MGRRDSPSYFDAGREMGLKRGDNQADEAHKCAVLRQFDGKRAEAMLLEVCLGAINQRIAFLACEASRKVAHYAWIGIHRRERLAIFVTPAPQQQSLGLNHTSGHARKNGRSDSII